MLLKLENLYIPIWGIVSLRKVDSSYEITYWAGDTGEPQLRKVEVNGQAAFELEGWISGQYVVQVKAAKTDIVSRKGAKSQRTERVEERLEKMKGAADSNRQQSADKR
jgi:hypothetical protein